MCTLRYVRLTLCYVMSCKSGAGRQQSDGLTVTFTAHIDGIVPKAAKRSSHVTETFCALPGLMSMKFYAKIV